MTGPAHFSHRSRPRQTILLGLSLAATAAVLASCDTPVGTPPGFRNSSAPTTQLTNPQGGGAQVVRWGPPESTFQDRGGR
jgi:hypothetical protein